MMELRRKPRRERGMKASAHGAVNSQASYGRDREEERKREQNRRVF